MNSLKNILTSKIDPGTQVDKYLTRDFQALGIRLSEELGDSAHKALYIKLAKTVDKKILEEALSFVVDSKARNKGALFMWKLKQIKVGNRISNLPN